MDLDEIKRGLRAEIKKRENEQYFTFQCNVRQMCKDVLAKLEEQESVIAELKQKLENVQASMYCDVVDANMESFKLRRALWLSRANSAEGQFFYWCVRFGVESGFTKADIRGYSVNTKRRLRTIGEWIEYWKNVKSKCLKKAEEYK